MRLYKINMCQEAVQCGLEMLCNKSAICVIDIEVVIYFYQLHITAQRVQTD